MAEHKPYEFVSTHEEFDLKNVFIDINSKLWKKPKTLTIDNLGGMLNVKINEDIKHRNVTCVEYVNQNENPDIPPHAIKVNTQTHIAVDENYLYVWVQSLKKWKRILLSDWK